MPRQATGRSRGEARPARRVALGFVLLAALLLAAVLTRSLTDSAGRGAAVGSSTASSGSAEPATWWQRAARWLGVSAPTSSAVVNTRRSTASGAAQNGTAERGAAAASDSMAALPSANPGSDSASERTARGNDPGPQGAASPTPVGDAQVTGRVLDATGGSVAGAHVSVAFDALVQARYRETKNVAGALAPDAQWTSDARGEFQGRVPSGLIHLEASADAYATARKSVQAPVLGVELVLAPASRIAGRVESADQRPLSGARVHAQMRGIELLPVEAHTDAAGAFTIPGVRAGIIELTASAEGFAPAQQWLRLSLAEASPHVVLRLAAARSVTGRVLVAGRPCTAGMVRAAGPLSPTSPLDGAGRYRVDGLLEGQHSLSASCPGAAPETRTLSIGRDTPARLELDWELGAGQVQTGSVRRSDGEPVAGAQLRVQAFAPPPGATGPAAAASANAFMGHSASECRSDAEGAYACGGLAPGYYRIGAELPGRPGAVSELFMVVAEPPPPVHLVLPDGGVVRVRLAAGGSGTVAVERAYLRREGQHLSGIGTPVEGGFVFDRLELGRYRVGLTRALDEVGPSVADVELKQPGQVVEVELTPAPALAIAGSVVDRQRQPVPDAWIRAWAASAFGAPSLDASDAVLTGVDGSFELPGLSPGRYVVAVEHPRGATRQGDVDAGRRGLALVLDEFGSMSGAVTTPDGLPAPAFSVLLMNPGASPVRVDGSRGRWEMPWLASGDYRVLVLSSSGGASTSARVEPGRATELDLQLDPKLAGTGIQNAAR